MMEAFIRRAPALSYCGEPFQHDIFVSYSHGSDDQGQGRLQEWSLAFARALREELCSDRAFRNTLKMFIDAAGEAGSRIDPALPLTEQLESQVQTAALLLVLMSPDYQASRWCADERAWWLAKQKELAQQGLPAAGRLELVHIWPVAAEDWPDGRWPAELADSRGHPLVGHVLHDAAPVGARPLGWTQWRAAEGFDPDVRGRILDIARDLISRLRAARDEAGRFQKARVDQQRLALEVGQQLYLHARPDGAAEWDRTALALSDGGFSVLPTALPPASTDPNERQAQRAERVEAMSGCDGLIVLGTGPGIDLDLAPVGKFDRQSARAQGQRRLPWALLNLVGETFATPLRQANARIMQAAWLDAADGHIVPRVQSWLHSQAGS
jgi:MTH538 TIR-like domain (DUF1863)